MISTTQRTGAIAITRWTLPGAVAGMVMATWAMAVALFTSEIWAPPQGVAQAIGLGHAGHDFQPAPILVGVVLHTINSLVIGGIFVAGARRVGLVKPSAVVAAATVYAIAVYAFMSEVVLRGILSANSGSFITATPEWGWAVAHVLFGIALGLVTVWVARRDQV